MRPLYDAVAVSNVQWNRAALQDSKIVIGENQTFLGAEDWLRSQGVQLDVVQDEECIEMMRKFITERPELWNEDIAV
jgi:hypothetical protein